jgi:hypothetical protein
MGVQLRAALYTFSLLLAARAEASPLVEARAQRRLADATSGEELKPWVKQLTTKSGAKWVFRPDGDARSAKLASDYGTRPGTNNVRERAVYLTSRHLRLGVVPQTLKGEFQGRSGTFQRYVDGYNGAIADPARTDWDSYQGVAILHYVTNMQDGHPGNVIISKSPTKSYFHAIDGELTFGNGPLLSMVIKRSLKVHPMSERLQQRIAKVDIAAWSADLLKEGLTQREVDGAVERLRKVQREGLAALPER